MLIDAVNILFADHENDIFSYCIELLNDGVE
jgi:hypothetical protein